MQYEEKLIRYIASKLIQRKYFMKKNEFPNEKKLIAYINAVLKDLKEQYRQLKYVRIKDPHGLITPAITESVNKLKIL